MTTEQFVLWLAQWLSRHPVKSPADTTRAVYTQEVMARVEALSRPSTASDRWQVWRHPQWMLALGGAVAAVVLLLAIEPRQMQLAREDVTSDIPQLAEALSGAGEDPSDVLAEVEASDPNEMADELTAIDRLMLAEAPKSTDASQSIWQDLEMLNQLEDESGADSELMDDESDESADELLEELEWMDRASSASS